MTCSPLLLVLALLPVSNGHGVATFDPATARVSSLRPHLYARADADDATRELLGDVYFGLRVDGANAWLSDAAVEAVGYVPGTGIVRVAQSHGAVRAVHYLFASFDAGAPHLVALVEVTNDGDAPLADSALFSLHAVDAGDAETLAWLDGAFEQRADSLLVLHRAVGAAPDRHALDPRAAVDAGARLDDTDGAGPADELTVGFEWDLAGLAPGETRTFGVVLGVAEGGDRTALDAALQPLAGTAAEARAAAEADWAAFFARAAEPAGLSADEAAVYRQALALIRMAQVRESGAARGQIVAGLDRAELGRTWVRDQAYATRALIRAGLFAEARAAFEFLFRSTAGAYEAELSGPYALSVLRYFGAGQEETDVDADGPVLGLDGFGLTLGALAEYAAATGDDALLVDHREALLTLTADSLMQLIDIDDSLLVRDDNSIWNADRRKHTFSQAATVWGLRGAARIAERLGDVDRTGQYDVSADFYVSAIVDRLVDKQTQRLNAAFQTERGVLDGAVAEAFNWDVVPADGEVATATLAALRAGLVAGAGPGYVRNDDGDDRESTFVDLRVATAARRAGDADHADALLAHVTARARANADLVPDAHADGAATVGLAAGVYALALWERADATPPASDAGCGCSATQRSAPGAALVIALATALAARPRRRRRR